MLKWINRIRKFDFNNLKWWQILLGVAGGIIILYLFVQVVQLLFTLLPLAIAILGIYFAYRWLSQRAENVDIEDIGKTKGELAVEEALKNREAAQSGEVSAAEDVVVTDDGREIREADLIVKQVVNPETGFKEPDISRLIEREEEKLKEADKITDDVMSQLEARRQRLLKNQDND